MIELEERESRSDKNSRERKTDLKGFLVRENRSEMDYREIK